MTLYTPYHADWIDSPDGIAPTATPITAAFLEYLETGLVDASSNAVDGFFNIEDYGASYLLSDNTDAINDAIEACGAAGGGIVWVPPVPIGEGYRLSTNPVSSGWALQCRWDNVHLRGAGAGSRIYGDLGTGVGVIGFQGAAKPTGLYPTQADSQYQRYTVYPVTAPAAGAATLTLTTVAHAAKFAVDDYIYLRTGETLPSNQLEEPEATINQVVGISGAVLSLAWPLPQAFVQQYHASGTATTLASSTVANNPAVVLTSAAGFSVNDYVTIAGAAGKPDHTSQIESKVSNTLTLMQAPQYVIDSGAIVHNATGVTTTTSSAYPSAFGVAPVTDTTITNCSIGSLLVESLVTFAAPIRVDQVVGFEAKDCLFRFYGPGIIGNKMTWVDVSHNRYDNTPQGTDQAWALSSGSGSDFITFHGNRVHSTGHAGVVFVESTQHWKVEGNTFAVTTKTGSDFVVNNQTRAGRGSVQNNNFVVNGPGAAIYGDPLTTHGGIVQGNVVDGIYDNAFSVILQGDGWTYGTNHIMAGGVIITTTFGNTTVGTDWDTVPSDYQIANMFTLDDDSASVTKITAYMRGVAGGSRAHKFQIYTDTAGPDDLVGETAAGTIAANQDAGWVDFTFASPLTMPGSGDYWICFHSGPTADKSQIIKVGVTNAASFKSRAYASGALDPFGTPDGQTSVRYSMYATYTTQR